MRLGRETEAADSWRRFSSIFGPDGKPLIDRRPPDWEGVICAEIDLGQISLAKAAADPTGHYARADVMRLLINRSPNPRVHEFKLPLDVDNAGINSAPFPA